MIKIAPSMLAADYANFERDIRRLEEAGADWLHIDIMDGVFVGPISFGHETVKAIRGKSGLFFDVHLMVSSPWKHIEPFIKAGADSVTIHLESGGDTHAMLKHIHALGAKAAVSINPPTAWESVLEYLNEVDMVLIMSVNPGYGGQKYIDSASAKLAALRSEIAKRGLDVRLEVDGGINEQTIGEALSSGADTIVAGSYVFKAEDMGKAVASLRG